MTEFLLIILQVIILDGILSIDNAAALGAIASSLPDNKPAPLPKWLKWLGANQQESALKAGIFGAYIGRGLMLLIIGFVISYPILKVIGALYLLYLVFNYFKGLFIDSGEDEDNRFNKGAGRFWKTVLMIEIADLAFSIDNVVAVVALSSHIWIIIFGVCISIVIMRFAAAVFIKMLKFEPLLEHAAYILILAIAVELILKYFGFEIKEMVQFLISVAIVSGFLAYGQAERRFKWKIN